MKICLIEGPDGVGKTTFIGQLNKLLGGPVVLKHFTHEDCIKEPSPVKRYADYIEATHKEYGDDCTIIFDRGWYSDSIYGAILRGKPDATTDDIAIIERLCKGYGELFIFMITAQIEVAWKRCKARGEDLITDKDLFKKICGAYSVSVPRIKETTPGIFYEVRT